MTHTINESGRVEEIRIVDSTHRMFERPARLALEKYRYLPVRVDGEPVAVEAMPRVIVFQHDAPALRDRREACGLLHIRRF